MKETILKMDVAEKEQFTAERNEPYHFFGRCI
jgi:hypothetical protein